MYRMIGPLVAWILLLTFSGSALADRGDANCRKLMRQRAEEAIMKTRRDDCFSAFVQPGEGNNRGKVFVGVRCDHTESALVVFLEVLDKERCPLQLLGILKPPQPF